MKNKVKFKFGQFPIISPSFVCQGCLFPETLMSLHNRCPVLRYVYDAPEHLVCTSNDSWFSLPETQNIAIEAEDLVLEWKSFFTCKKLAKNCPMQKSR